MPVQYQPTNVNWGALNQIGENIGTARRGDKLNSVLSDIPMNNGVYNWNAIAQKLFQEGFPQEGLKFADIANQQQAAKSLNEYRQESLVPPDARLLNWWTNQGGGAPQPPSVEAQASPPPMSPPSTPPSDASSPYAGMPAAIQEKVAPLEEQARLKAQGERTGKENPQAKVVVSRSLADITKAYINLAKEGGMVQTGQGYVNNLAARAGSSDVGQLYGGAVGTKTQAYRDVINQTRPALINAIRMATGMSAKAMDSNVELQFYLQQASDPTKGLYANLQAINALDKNYGLGGVLEEIVASGLLPPEVLQAISSGEAPGKPIVAPQGSGSGGKTKSGVSWSLEP